MRQFWAPTEDIIKSAKSYISTDYNAGVTEITLDNAEQFVTGKYVIVGREGDESAELRRITVSGNKLTLASATTFPHYHNELVTQLDYDQRKLYYRETSAGDWTHVSSGSPKTIAVSSPLGTLMEDSAGESTYEYVCTYYDSGGNVETEQDDCTVVEATSESVNLCSIQSIRVSAGWQDNIYVSDVRLDEARQQAQGEVWASLRRKYTFPLTKYSSFLERIVIDMAVGYLFIDEYGMDVQNVALDGYKRLEDAKIRLDRLRTGEMTLYDESTGEKQTLTAVDTIKYYPDASTDESANPENDDERIFSIGMKF